MIVEFSDEAESDLEQIADYIAKDNPRLALSFAQELRGKCERLKVTLRRVSLWCLDMNSTVFVDGFIAVT